MIELLILSLCAHVLLATFRIHCIPNRDKNPLPKKKKKNGWDHGYDTKLHLTMRFQFWSSRKWSTLIAITLRSTLTMCGSTCWGPIYGLNRSNGKLLVLQYLILYNCKLFILGIVTWSYDYLLRIIMSYLKQNKYVQINEY